MSKRLTSPDTAVLDMDFNISEINKYSLKISSVSASVGANRVGVRYCIVKQALNFFKFFLCLFKF